MNQEKFEFALERFPVNWEELQAELALHMNVAATDKEKYYHKYIATLDGCSYDALDTFSSYISTNSISLHFMDETYVGFGQTEEEARVKCMLAYLKDFTEIFSDGAMKLETAYLDITRIERDAIAKLLEYEEKVKNLTSKA